MSSSTDHAHHGIAGGISGLCSRLVTEPLDVIKIRFQLQLEPIRINNHGSKYRGITQTAGLIIREEGLSALWKGLTPGLMLYVIFGSVHFSCYGFISHQLTEHFNIKNRIVRDSISGGLGGSIATMICQPLDVLRTRLIGQGEPKHYDNLRKAVILMYRENGIKTFYRGLLPSLLMILPQSSLHFGLYSLYLSSLQRITTSTSQVTPLHGNFGISSLVCGALAGATSKAIVLPLDIIKKRLQIQGFEMARMSFGRVGKYNGVRDTFVKILREEGVFGFYKGTLPSVIKTSVATSVTFFTFELVMKLLSKSHN